jgi:hypothetical protein
MKPILSALLLSAAVACSFATGPRVEVNGTIHYNPIEGGFYEIVSDADGVHYDPTNLPDCYKEEGLRVQATLRVRKDLSGFHMAGPIVNVESISSPGRICAVLG